MAARFFEEYSNIDFDFVCGAASHKNHKREKGFDHVEEICRHFSRLTDIRYCQHALLKIRSTAKQRSLIYEMRMKNLVDSMIVNERVDEKIGGLL
jgi:predicted amidophosphoribosyltransferase